MVPGRRASKEANNSGAVPAGTNPDIRVAILADWCRLVTAMEALNRGNSRSGGDAQCTRETGPIPAISVSHETEGRWWRDEDEAR